MTGSATQGGRVGYGIAALVAGLAAASGLGWAAVDGAALAQAGLVGSAWYLVVVATGFAAAAFLFGFMTSTGAADGRLFNIKFRFGGAAAVFLLILVTGWAAAPKADAGILEGRIVDSNGNDAHIARAQIRIDIGGLRYVVTSDENGAFSASGIPASLKGRTGSLQLYKDDVPLLPKRQTFIWIGTPVWVTAPVVPNDKSIDNHYLMIPGAVANRLCGKGDLLKKLGDPLIKTDKVYLDFCVRARKTGPAGRDYASVKALVIANESGSSLENIRVFDGDGSTEMIAWLGTGKTALIITAIAPLGAAEPVERRYTKLTAQTGGKEVNYTIRPSPPDDAFVLAPDQYNAAYGTPF